jgi:glycosyltransferase involved in cell wall biosynthesis
MAGAAHARSVTLVVPGDLETRTGGYGYDREIVAGLRRLGWIVTICELGGGFPFPSPEERAAAGRALGALPAAGLVVVDGLALGALPDEAAAAARRLRLIGLVHHPLADETGLADATRAALEDSERRALRAVARVVVTSAATAAGLDRYGVPAPKIAVIEPGTDPAPLSRGSRGAIVELLCVATLVPRKGHDVLLRALATMPEAAWHLSCVGGLDRDAVWTARLREQVQGAALEPRVAFAGEMGREALDVCYDAADVFVLPTWYEGYGMAVAEALARGLPVVSTATGGIGGLVGADAGLLVPPGDASALARALSAIVSDPALRVRLAAGARRVRDRLPSWDDGARRLAQVLEDIDG